MVYFGKRLPEAVVNDCNERIVRHGLNVIRSSDSQDPGGDSGSGGGSATSGDQPRVRSDAADLGITTVRCHLCLDGYPSSN
jgi:hypothetical protein